MLFPQGKERLSVWGKSQAICLKRCVVCAHDERGVLCFGPQQDVAFMPRRGWSTLEVPGGWLQLLRGPCPKSERWPLRSPQTGHQQFVSLVCRGAWGLQSLQNLQRSQDGGSAQTLPEPWCKRKHENSKRLRKSWPTWRGQQWRRSVPNWRRFKVQRRCQLSTFRIARSQRRLTELEKQRVTEEELLLEAKARLESLRAQAEQVRVAPSVATNAEGELVRLRAQVVELQRAVQDRKLAAASKGDQPAKKPRLREDFVPMCVEDAVLWLKCRQQEMEDAISSGNQLDVRFPAVCAWSFASHHQSTGSCCGESNAVSPEQVWVARCEKASNPGPLSSDDVGGSFAEEEFLDQFQQDLMSGRRRRVRRRVVDIDSDTSLEDARSDGRPSRRVVLVPGSEDGTQQSIPGFQAQCQAVLRFRRPLLQV